MRVKLISGVVLVAVALALWRFMPGLAGGPSTETPSLRGRSPSHEPLASRTNSGQPPASPTAEPTLNERTLVGTKWEREGFGIEFGADGKLLIGGRERARWRVEGSRIRLYRETTGEEHWLDIVGDRLLWEGKEIGRVP